MNPFFVDLEDRVGKSFECNLGDVFAAGRINFVKSSNTLRSIADGNPLAGPLEQWVNRSDGTVAYSVVRYREKDIDTVDIVFAKETDVFILTIWIAEHRQVSNQSEVQTFVENFYIENHKLIFRGNASRRSG